MTSTVRKSAADENRWICFYPSYINAKKTQKEGRKIPKAKAVETPTCQEISDILKNAGFNLRVEKKLYPRDQNRDYNLQSRIRLQLKNEDGELCNETFPTRDSVFLYVAEMIPKLKSRQQRGATSATVESSGPQQKAAGGKQKKKR